MAHYIKPDTSLGLAFEKGPSFDDTHWTLTTTGDLALITPPGDPNFGGLKEVPIITKNKTSYRGVLKVTPVQVVNTNYTVTWASTVRPLYLKPDAAAGGTYELDLNQYRPALLRTQNGTQPVSDVYNFISMNFPAQCHLEMDPQFFIRTKLVCTNLAPGEIKLNLIARSGAADKRATGSNLGSEVQEFTIIVRDAS